MRSTLIESTKMAILHDNTIHATNVASNKLNVFQMLSVNMVGLNGENEKYVKVKTCWKYFT